MGRTEDWPPIPFCTALDRDRQATSQPGFHRLIWERDRPKFGEAEGAYRNKHIGVTEKITNYKESLRLPAVRNRGSGRPCPRNFAGIRLGSERKGASNLDGDHPSSGSEVPGPLAGNGPAANRPFILPTLYRVGPRQLSCRFHGNVISFLHLAIDSEIRGARRLDWQAMAVCNRDRRDSYVPAAGWNRVLGAVPESRCCPIS